MIQLSGNRYHGVGACENYFVYVLKPSIVYEISIVDRAKRSVENLN